MASTLPPNLSVLLSRPAPSLAPPTSVYDPDLTVQIEKAGKGKGKNWRAALHLLNDDINACHELVQSQEGNMISDSMHAMLHRREGEYWNSKWWLSRINNPVFKSLHGSSSGAKSFVDRVEQAVLNNRGDSEEELKELQWTELKEVAEQAFNESR
ncbi:hypothetical protein BT69DRAFT_1346396 [Atractiella rhizophila]|nr:hypothetical protein BT69DRAFT_1346396 [Atractiella rhizophila]